MDPLKRDHTINHKATSGKKTVALNVTSDNTETSAMYLTGVETEHGTPKIAHVGYADGSDPGSSALSIDLMTAGTAAQGIFVTATDAPTKGALLVLRSNPGPDDFVGQGNGTAGVGMGRGNNPQSQLHVIQRTGSASAVLAEGAVRLANVAAEPSGAPAAVGGGSLYAQEGKLYWKPVGGKPTLLA